MKNSTLRIFVGLFFVIALVVAFFWSYFVSPKEFVEENQGFMIRDSGMLTFSNYTTKYRITQIVYLAECQLRGWGAPSSKGNLRWFAVITILAFSLIVSSTMKLVVKLFGNKEDAKEKEKKAADDKAEVERLRGELEKKNNELGDVREKLGEAKGELKGKVKGLEEKLSEKDSVKK